MTIWYKGKVLSKWKLAKSSIHLSLFGYFVFAFTLDICFYFENTRAESKYQTVKCRSRKTRLVSWLNGSQQVE